MSHVPGPVLQFLPTATHLPQLLHPPCRSSGGPSHTRRLKVTVISWPASVHHLRVFEGPTSSRMCSPAIMCCLQSCWARVICKCTGMGCGVNPDSPTLCTSPCLSHGEDKGPRRSLFSLTISKGSIMYGETLACSQGERAHIHGTGGDRGDGEDGRHQHSERPRRGKDLLAALLCRGER